MSAIRPYEEPVLISEWLDDPQTVDLLESILAQRVGPDYRLRARLAVLDDDRPWGDETQLYLTKRQKLHERDAAVWLVERLRERFP